MDAREIIVHQIENLIHVADVQTKMVENDNRPNFNASYLINTQDQILKLLAQIGEINLSQ